MPVRPQGVARLWQDVNEAISQKEIDPESFRRIYIGGIEEPDLIKPNRSLLNRVYYLKKNSKFYLGESFPQTYFTCREAEVMYFIMKGYTNNQVGEVLGLSSRTVEYYIRNMRQKVKCRSKSHLIRTIMATDFDEHVRIE